MARKNNKTPIPEPEEMELADPPRLALAEVAGVISEETLQNVGGYLQSLALNPKAFRGKKGGLQLRQTDMAGRIGEPIGEWSFDGETMGPEELSDLATEIAGAAHAEAEQLGQGLWLFALVAIRDGAPGGFARRSIKIYVENSLGDPAKDHDAQALQKGDAVAFVGQNQRHIEALMRQNSLLIAQMSSTTNALVGQLSARLELSERTNMDAFKLIRDAIEATDARAAATRQDEHRIKRNEQIVSTFLQLAPMLVPFVMKHFGMDPAMLAAGMEEPAQATPEATPS